MDPIIVALLVLLPFIPARYLHSWWAVTPGTVIARARLGWRERLRGCIRRASPSGQPCSFLTWRYEVHGPAHSSW